MIIERKYENFGYLYENDEKAREVINRGFELAGYSDDYAKKLIQINWHEETAFFVTDSFIPSSMCQFLIREFELLDQEYPYDNHLDYTDVNSIEFEASRKGNAIQLRLLYCDRIVGIVTVDNTNNNMKLIEPWYMGAHPKHKLE